MIEILMLLTLSPLATQTAQFQPCVWPNPCSKNQIEQTVVAEKYEICVWPKTCSKTEVKETIVAADFEICVWPRKCGAGKVA